MNSQQIEYFLSAVKHLNFTKVADDFYTSQPTISRQIALLESELGFELFRRDKGNLRLTPGGTIMAGEFAKANQIINDAISKVGRVAGGLEGELSIGYVNGMNTDTLIHPPTTAFATKYPGIRITIEAASFSGIRNKINSGEFDVVFTYDFEVPAYQDIMFRKVYAVNPVILMPGSHPLAGKDDIDFSEFSGEVLLAPGLDETNFGRYNIIRVLEKLGVKDVRIRDMQNIESVLFGVLNGMGIAVVDTSMECVHDNRYSYVLIPRDADGLSLYLCILWKKENLNPTIPLYNELLRETLNIEFFYD